MCLYSKKSMFIFEEKCATIQRSVFVFVLFKFESNIKLYIENFDKEIVIIFDKFIFNMHRA